MKLVIQIKTREVLQNFIRSKAGMSNTSWGLNKLFQAIVKTRGLAEGVKAPQKANPMLFVFQVII